MRSDTGSRRRCSSAVGRCNIPPLWVKERCAYYISISNPLRSIKLKPSHSTGVVGSISNETRGTFAFFEAIPDRQRCIRGKSIGKTKSI